MKKSIYISIFLMISVCYASWVEAQSACPVGSPRITTDWRKTGSVNSWNWTNAWFDMYITNRVNPQTKPSPFIDPNNGNGYSNPNLVHFNMQSGINYDISKIDCWPEDGWELLYKKFGTRNATNDPNLPEDPNYSTINPYFILYNRFTGTVRAFVLMTDQTISAVNGANLVLSFKPGVKSALLSHIHPITNVVKEFVAPIMQVPNYFIDATNSDFWLYADYPMAYDPCACLNMSELEFRVKLINQSDVKLEGIGGIKQVSSTSGNVNTTNGFQSVIDYYSGMGKAGSKSYTEWSKFETSANKFVEANQTYIKDNMNIDLSEFKKFSQYIPYVGFFVGTVDFFVNGGKTRQTPPAAFEAGINFNINGSITDPTTALYETFVNPGTASNTQLKLPYYNHVLGVFNVLQIPTLQYFDHVSVDESYYCEQGHYNFTGDFIPVPGFINYPKIREYKLSDEPIIYAVNPASGLAVKDIKVALVYQPDMPLSVTTSNKKWYGPVELGPLNTGLPYPDRMNDVNLEIERWTRGGDSINGISYKTPWLPLNCISGYKASFFEHSGYSNKVYLKFMIILQHTDPDYSGNQEVLMVITYNVNQVSAGGGLYTPSCFNSESMCYPQDCYVQTVSPSPWPDPYLDIKPNVHITSSPSGNNPIKAWNTITVAPNVTLPSGIELIAGREIIVEDPNTITPEVTLKIEQPASCSGQSGPASGEVLNTFCQSNEYKQRAGLMRMANPKDTLKEKINLKVYPNPVQAMTTIQYSIPQDGYVDITIADLSGRTVIKVKSGDESAGEHTINLTEHRLQPGVYFCRLQTPFGERSEKIIVVE